MSFYCAAFRGRRQPGSVIARNPVRVCDAARRACLQRQVCCNLLPHALSSRLARHAPLDEQPGTGYKDKTRLEDATLRTMHLVRCGRTHLRRHARCGPLPYAFSSQPARCTRSEASSRAPSPHRKAGELSRSAAGEHGCLAILPAPASVRARALSGIHGGVLVESGRSPQFGHCPAQPGASCALAGQVPCLPS